MNKKKTQQKQIVIAVVLLLFLAVANYKNYYDTELDMLPSYDPTTNVEQSQEAVNTEEKVAVEKKVLNKFKTNKSSSLNISGDNYLVYVVDSNGVLVRWRKKKIKVHVEPSVYNETIRRALRTYNSTFVDYFEFIPSKKNNADVNIQMVESFESNNTQGELYMAGVTHNVFAGKDKRLSYSDMKLLSMKPNSKKRISDAELYPVVMHELGHALGIIGHSQNSSDVMYAFSTSNSGELSQRDINTIKMMYSDDNELIARETADFANKKLEEAKTYVKNSPNKALSWINLAKVYYDINMKEEALEAYKKALTIEPSNSVIYQSMAECYYSSEKYDTAIKYYNYALEKATDFSMHPALYNMIGLSYAHKEDSLNAYNAFKQAFEFSSANKLVLHNLLAMCMELNKKQEATEYITRYKNSGGDMDDEILRKAEKWIK